MRHLESCRVVVLAALVGIVAPACGSSPDPVYYSLAANPMTPGAAHASWAHVIKLRRPALAGYLDRTDIVSRVANYRLHVASGDSWSEPLGDMIGRVLAEDLSQRLAGSVVFTEMSPISADPDAVVSVDIQRFDAGSDGTLTLRAEVAVERAKDRVPIAVETIELHGRPASSDTASLVAAMSDLVAQLAARVAPYLESR
jgi:uncharacterized lipoprotein YmbA